MLSGDFKMHHCEKMDLRCLMTSIKSKTHVLMVLSFELIHDVFKITKSIYFKLMLLSLKH